MISASKTTFSHYNLKILRPKVTKNITILRKKFYESTPCNVQLRGHGRNSQNFLSQTRKIFATLDL